jgi:hypothetical protein
MIRILTILTLLGTGFARASELDPELSNEQVMRALSERLTEAVKEIQPQSLDEKIAFFLTMQNFFVEATYLSRWIKTLGVPEQWEQRSGLWLAVIKNLKNRPKILGTIPHVHRDTARDSLRVFLKPYERNGAVRSIRDWMDSCVNRGAFHVLIPLGASIGGMLSLLVDTPVSSSFFSTFTTCSLLGAATGAAMLAISKAMNLAVELETGVLNKWRSAPTCSRIESALVQEVFLTNFSQYFRSTYARMLHSLGLQAYLRSALFEDAATWREFRDLNFSETRSKERIFFNPWLERINDMMLVPWSIAEHAQLGETDREVVITLLMIDMRKWGMDVRVPRDVILHLLIPKVARANAILRLSK